MWYSKKLSEILDPYLVVLNSLPKSALAPLLIVWLGANQTTIIIAGMSVAIFGSILNLYTSFTTIDEEKIKLIYTLHGTRHHALTKVVLPSSIPAIISNMKVNIGLCLVGVIIGEFLAARNGLGYLIIYSSQDFKMDWLLMSIVLLCIMAMGLYALINLVEKLCKKRFSKNQGKRILFLQVPLSLILFMTNTSFPFFILLCALKHGDISLYKDKQHDQRQNI